MENQIGQEAGENAPQARKRAKTPKVADVVFADFVKYAKQHPNERFYQKLKNWSGVEFIMLVKQNDGVFNISEAEKLGLRDTYYFEGKDG